MVSPEQARYRRLVAGLSGDAAGLHELGRALRSDFDCDRVSLYRRSPRNVYVAVYAEGLQDMTLSVKPGEGLVGKALQRGVPVLSNAAPYDPDALSRLRDHYSGYETHSVLVAPILRWLCAPLGAVQLVNSHAGSFPAADLLRLAEVAKGLAGIGKFCRSASENLWQPDLHKDVVHDHTASA